METWERDQEIIEDRFTKAMKLGVQAAQLARKWATDYDLGYADSLTIGKVTTTSNEVLLEVVEVATVCEGAPFKMIVQVDDWGVRLMRPAGMPQMKKEAVNYVADTLCLRLGTGVGVTDLMEKDKRDEK